MVNENSLQSFINASNLSDDDKALWDILKSLNKEETCVLNDFIEQNEERLAFLTNNLRMKQQFSKNADPALLEKMIKTTEEYLTKLAE